MCDQKIKTPFETVSNEMELFPMNNVAIPYGGPTIKEDVQLDSFGTTENMISKITFTPTGDICINKDGLVTTGEIKIQYFRTGPYQTIGGTLEFRRLFFHFKDLILNVKVKFVYNTDNICSNNPTDTKLFIIIDREKGVDFDEYFVTDGTDITNINDLFYDLTMYFKNYSSNFGVLFDILLNSLLEKSGFVKIISNEFIRIICEDQKLSKTTTTVFRDKLQRLKINGDMDVIIKNKNNFYLI